MTAPGISSGFNFSTSKLRNEEVSASMLIFSKFAGNIWKALRPRFHATSGLRRKCVSINNEIADFSLIDVLLGKFDIDKDSIVINHILLLSKFYIYRCKFDITKQSSEDLRLN